MSDNGKRKIDPDLERTINDGTNRRAGEASKSGSSQQPNSCAGGAGTQGAHQGSAPSQTTSQGAGIIQGACINPYLQIGVIFRNVGRRDKGIWAPPWMVGELGVPNAAVEWQPHLDAAALPSSGVYAGEIVAWRAWHWNGKRLRSIFVNYEWPLQGPAKGQPGCGYGIHAFKERGRAFWEYRECINHVLIGEVALWGDVVEFEHGYTAEFARPLFFVPHVGQAKHIAEIMKLYEIDPPCE